MAPSPLQKQVARMILGRDHDSCPEECLACQKPVNPETDFVDELSRKEWEISHLCQSCQDQAFAYWEEENEDDMVY